GLRTKALLVDRPHTPWRAADRRAAYGKSVCAVRGGGGWRRTHAGTAPVLDPTRVQRKAGATSGCQSRRGKSQTPRSLDGRVEGNRDSAAYRQSHQRMVSESPGRNASEREVAPKDPNPGGRAVDYPAKATRAGAVWLTRRRAPAGLGATAR